MIVTEKGKYSQFVLQTKSRMEIWKSTRRKNKSRVGTRPQIRGSVKENTLSAIGISTNRSQGGLIQHERKKRFQLVFQLMVRTDILVSQFVRETNTLRLVLDGLAIDDGLLKLLGDCTMNGVALDKGESAHAPGESQFHFLGKKRPPKGKSRRWE